eukprot:4371705-Amphidinium_carterae.2
MGVKALEVVVLVAVVGGVVSWVLELWLVVYAGVVKALVPKLVSWYMLSAISRRVVSDVVAVCCGWSDGGAVMGEKVKCGAVLSLLGSVSALPCLGSCPGPECDRQEFCVSAPDRAALWLVSMASSSASTISITSI